MRDEKHTFHEILTVKLWEKLADRFADDFQNHLLTLI